MGKPQLSLEFLNQCFLLNEDTGSLTWKKRPREHFKNDRAFETCNARYAGKETGSPAGRGYLRTCINGKLYLNHRLVFSNVLWGRTWKSADRSYQPSENR